MLGYLKDEMVQVKDTLWEGGVRGAALLWSPQLEASFPLYFKVVI